MRKTLITAALALAATAAPAATASAKDVNRDRIPDRWERAYHLSLRVDQAKRDQDHDGLKNRAEWRDHTSPRSSDTDGDGVADPREDADRDGVPNGDEGRHGDQPRPTGDGHEGSSEPPHGDTTTPPHGDGAPGHVVSYSQSPNFGGYLTLERANGERVTAYFGERTDLECARAAAPEPAFLPCTKENLKPGTPVAAAEHGRNEGGSDVWTKVFLVVSGDHTDQPPATTPPPAQPAVGGTVVSYEQSQYFGGMLTIERPNGESVAAWYGDGTDLRCAPSADAAYAPCGKDQLQAGAVATDARHAVNAGGHDVWTRVYLVAPGFTG
jgi:hypothetical protein